ncbi:MAG: polyribonucleotide nucleotidyltransferase [Candidatus Omnitrophica bacterium]|nr:polyribonucleotide nucleotidyltransferase [Candidatus Omnitrophota bacterium]MDD5310300.1 polyribonucleotide nucleotidyltransferase [Candidatus Omnitrophota bacterium]MDD5545845.1 polyribonucleotide nucleotidyltransferase [Candidatus Omnitrophota bacterium]
MSKRLETKLGRENLIFETGRMAKQANGAVMVQYGGTVVLVTAVISKQPREGADIDFVPLTVEYQEKNYAAGKIPGGFFKREGRPSEKEVLTARLIDRPIRPLFPAGISHEIQVMALVLSHDGENDPDILALNGASCALAVSDIPFNYFIGAARVGMIEGEFIVNPTFAELEKSSLDIVVVGTKESIVMIESGMNELPEDVVLKAIEFGHKSLIASIELQEKMKAECGSPKGTDYTIKKIDEGLYKKVKDLSLGKIKEVENKATKEEREEMMSMIAKDLISQLVVEGSELTEAEVKSALVKVEKEEVRRTILQEKKRVDGRGFKDIRQITCEVGVLPRTHGSALFTRGQTQSLAVTTLGTSADEQTIDALEGESSKSFMLHYSFPPFSVGEVKPVRGPGRREIGHGALAERGLKPIMPSKEEFPYTVRVVSEVLESNGSSSMATVCAGTLSLMDAGVPIKAPVSGIAIGLVKEGKNFVILTDIAGLEDHFGDMDFKVTGTEKGVTAVQMDLKIDGIDLEIVKQSLEQAREARMIILEKIKQALAGPRTELSKYAPRIVSFKINPDKIRDVIGPGGKVIRKIIEDTGVTIDIEDDGTVNVASADGEALQKALDIINSLTQMPEVGKIYNGKVKRIMPFGAFVEILPGQEGLVHVSEMSDQYVKNVEDVVKLGDEFPVKLMEIDDQNRLNLSRKQAMPGYVPGEEKPREPREPRESRGHGEGRGERRYHKK